MRNDEKDILARAARGDADAFGRVAEKYQGLVYATSFQIVKDHSAARDLAQDALVRAFTQLGRLRDLDAFPSWLRQIVRHAALAWTKTHKRHVPIEDAGILRVEPTPSANL